MEWPSVPVKATFRRRLRSRPRRYLWEPHADRRPAAAVPARGWGEAAVRLRNGRGGANSMRGKEGREVTEGLDNVVEAL